MGTLLAAHARVLLLAAAVAAAPVWAESDRHQLYVDASVGWVSASTDLGPWTEGAVGKLRHVDDGFTALRVFGEYQGRITPTLRARIVADYVDDASDGFDLTEAVLDWRPIPRSRNQQQWRFGAFYPAFSLENGDRGWQSPFTYSYSAINTWLAEEIRPLGAEWSLRRRLEGFRSAHELRVFAAGFYGNDPAATLLFWRGWSLHDRQTRLSDELTIPPLPWSPGAQRLAPFTETDHRPGVYGGLEWRYARRALVQWARYDNRADPYSFEGYNWGWRTDFNHLAAQVTLPAGFGVVAQWMRGGTDWVSGAYPDGTLASWADVVHDEFASRFLMLTRQFAGMQRLSLRYDTFSIERPAGVPFRAVDGGRAWTLSYRLEPKASRFGGGVEWLRIDSRRELWPLLYGTGPTRHEDQIRLQFSYRLAAPAAR